MERERVSIGRMACFYKGSCCFVLMGSSDTKSCIFLIIWQIRVIERNCEIPHEGPFCDLMWSDPEDIETWAVSPRGAGWLFGSRVTSEVMNLTSNRNMSHSLETNVMLI
jgi:diadenosine tetraphosphatase ApaH/serine/threonine PP2A family protein phosphatase